MAKASRCMRSIAAIVSRVGTALFMVSVLVR